MKKTIILLVLLLSITGIAQAQTTTNNTISEDFKQGYISAYHDIINQITQKGFVTIPISNNGTNSTIYLFPEYNQTKATKIASVLYGGKWIQEIDGTIRRPTFKEYKTMKQ